MASDPAIEAARRAWNERYDPEAFDLRALLAELEQSKAAASVDLSDELDTEIDNATGHLRAQLAQRDTVIRDIRELHSPIEALNVRYNRIQKVCSGCGTDDGNWQTYPCPTVRIADRSAS